MPFLENMKCCALSTYIKSVKIFIFIYISCVGMLCQHVTLPGCLVPVVREGGWIPNPGPLEKPCFIFLFVCFWFFRTKFFCITLAILELTELRLPLPPKYQD